jgi:hypothetical protein
VRGRFAEAASVFVVLTPRQQLHVGMTSNTDDPLTVELTRLLGARRTARLRRVVRQTGLPPEVLLDLALELLDIASRKLSPPPITRTAVGLGAARWRHVSPEKRSEAGRRAAEARWKKRREGKE